MQPWIIILVHFLFAVILFFLIKFIGNHTKRLEYSSLSDGFNSGNFFGYNATLRIFAPSVFILFVSILGYKYLPDIVKNAWIISLYYQLILFFVIWFLGRLKFINIKFYIFYFILSIFFSRLIYNYIIIRGLVYILPSYDSFKEEFRIIIILFFNNIFEKLGDREDDREKNSKRLSKYIKDTYHDLFLKYDKFISGDAGFKRYFYSIMIYENYNRSINVRKLENIYGFILKLFNKKTKISSGIMQIRATKILSDIESIKEATKLLSAVYIDTLKQLQEENIEKGSGDGSNRIMNNMAKTYSTDYKYESEISRIYYELAWIEYTS